MAELWNKNTEEDFFKHALAVASPDHLFYMASQNKYLAYWPNGYIGQKGTLQSRNSHIGDFTEKYCLDLLQPLAKKFNLHAVAKAICPELGLDNKSPADVAFCANNDKFQEARNIRIIFEVKMSIVWNWELISRNPFQLSCIGDYSTHQGNPSILRSDSMLKAIGKSINIRVSSFSASRVPIVVLGNTPVTNHYHDKVDHLKQYGIIQGFWSVNPKPLDSSQGIKNTRKNGFVRLDSVNELEVQLTNLLKNEQSFFAGMRSHKELGNMIDIASKEKSLELKAEKFLSLLQS